MFARDVSSNLIVSLRRSLDFIRLKNLLSPSRKCRNIVYIFHDKKKNFKNSNIHSQISWIPIFIFSSNFLSLFKYFDIPTTILNDFKNIYEIVHQVLFAIICFNRNQARFTDIRVGSLWTLCANVHLPGRLHCFGLRDVEIGIREV